MKNLLISFVIFGLLGACRSGTSEHTNGNLHKDDDVEHARHEDHDGDDEHSEEVRLLRHVVLFKFKEGTSSEDIAKVEEAFSALPAKIPEIYDYEWGINNSPEGLDKGFTHCFFLSFLSEEDRAVYLPHPDHQEFGKILGPHLEDVTVVDYWSF